MHHDRDESKRAAGCEWFRRQVAWEHQFVQLRERAQRSAEAIRLEPASARSPNIERAHREKRVA